MVEMKPPDRFRWLGRIDNIINSGGIKVHPETIERKLESRIGTHPYFVGGVPDSSLGEKVVLFVENREKIIFDRDWLFDGFHPYEKPRDIIVLSSFERTRTGKINRVKTIRKSGAL